MEETPDSQSLCFAFRVNAQVHLDVMLVSTCSFHIQETIEALSVIDRMAFMTCVRMIYACKCGLYRQLFSAWRAEIV